MRKILALTLLLAAAAAFACSGTPTTSNTQAPDNPNDTPTEAYKRLYAAVKSKNADAVRAELSAKTIALAKQAAAQQKRPEEEVLANGFTATTFSPTLPEMRDQRVKDTMGAVEVWNARDSIWEDIPFIRENGSWKLAYGDAFGKTWNPPGKGQARREQEAANQMNATNGAVPMVPGNANSNVNANSNTRANRK